MITHSFYTAIDGNIYNIITVHYNDKELSYLMHRENNHNEIWIDIGFKINLYNRIRTRVRFQENNNQYISTHPIKEDIIKLLLELNIINIIDNKIIISPLMLLKLVN